MANNTIPPLGSSAPVVYYRDYYSTTDPFNGNYLAALDPYTIPFNQSNILPPSVVQQMACDARQHRIPTAFILLGKRDHKLHVYCQLTKFTARHGFPASEWDNRMFITKGELYNNNGVLVEWPSDLFHQASQVRVPSMQAIEAELSDPEADLLGPYQPSDDDTVLIRTRRTCYVPPAYVPLFLTQPLTPREAWETVVQQILTDQRQEQCWGLINFIRSTLTRSVTGCLPSLAVDLPVHPNPVADAVLLAHRQEALLEVFPQLSQSASSVQSDQLNRSLGSIALELQIDRDLRVQSKARAETKDVSTLVGEFGVAKLLRLCQVSSVAALPGIWATLANTPKAQRLMALQWEVDRVKSQLRDHHLIFIVTNPLFEIVKSLGFEMVDNDSVDTGLNPFLLKDEDKRQVVSEQVYFSQIYSSEAAPSRQDIDVLSKAKPGAPLLPVQLRQQVKRLQVLHGVLFGMNSIHVTALNTYLEQLITREAEVYRLMATTPLLPVLLAKKLTVQHNTWLRNQALSDVPLSAPFYDRIFDDIDMENRWEPTLTPRFMERIGLGEVDPSFASSNTFHPSPAPAPAPLPGPSSIDTTVNNPHFNEELFGRVRHSRMSCRIMRQQIRDGQLPELPSSKVDQLPICLAYHAKGQCNQRCGRKVDHVPYSATEYEPLTNWCNTNWPQEEPAQS